VTCKEAALLLTQSIDEPLPRRVALRLRLHLLICRTCATLKKELIALSEAAALLAAQDPSELQAIGAPGLDPQIAEALKKRIRDEEGKNSL